MEGQTKNVDTTPNSETTTVPATSQETQDATEALLLLGKPPEQALPGLNENEVLMPIAGPQQPNIEPLPGAPPEVNPTNPPEMAPRPGTLLGVAIKTYQGDNPTTTEDQPDDADDDDDNQTEDKNRKKKTFVTKEYGLKRRAKTKRKFKCGVCAAELERVCDYNQHYLDNHPPTPCPHCP